MSLSAPPYQQALVVPENPFDPRATKLPKLVIDAEWFRWLGDGFAVVDTTSQRKAKANLSDQHASLGATPFALGTIPAGVYRVSYIARITTPAATSSSLTVTVAWTSGAVTITQSGAAIVGNTTATVQFGTLILRVDAATPITYATTYASDVADEMRYSLDLVLEALALDT